MKFNCKMILQIILPWCNQEGLPHIYSGLVNFQFNKSQDKRFKKLRSSTGNECSHDLNYLSCYLLNRLFALNDAYKVPTTYREERLRSKLKNHVHLNVKEGTGLYQESFSFTRILLNV